MLKTTFFNAKTNLADLCDEVIQNGEIVIISRRSRGNIAMIAATELISLLETAHLMRSSKNALRLLTAIDRAVKTK